LKDPLGTQPSNKDKRCRCLEPSYQLFGELGYPPLGYHLHRELKVKAERQHTWNVNEENIRKPWRCLEEGIPQKRKIKQESGLAFLTFSRFGILARKGLTENRDSQI
jgi:hypothetical protein